MPYDIHTETAETKSGKPVKRVRFSDEVQNVYDCAGSDENSGSISLENESNKTCIKSSVGVESSEFYTKESTKYDVSSSLFSSSSETTPDRVQAIVQPSEQKNSVTSLSRKRSLEGMLIEKQTSKLNTCLRKSSSEISSADELKNAVYNAWYKVKNEKSPPSSSQFIPEMKKIIDTSQKTITNDAYETWKKSKKKAKKMSPTKKISHKVSEPVSPKTKEEIEESKMAFRAWKKKKDELLKHQLTEKYKKEERERLDSLMNERIRKNDAESAFSAWNAHKSVIIKMERKKNQWLLEKEREKLEVKIKKGEEAEQIYYDWLKNKVCSSKGSTCAMIEDKPPWTPPGKANSLL